MEIVSAIVHRVEKSTQSDSLLHLRDAELPMNDRLMSLVSRLRDLYGSKASFAYGEFEENTDVYPFSKRLAEKSGKDWSFVGFSKAAMEILKGCIDGQSFATGGYILFVIYTEKGEEFLLIASLKNKSGFVIDANLSLTDQQHVDMDHLHEMARVNLSKWVAKDPRYVSFVKRRSSSQDFTQYFRKFIGCTEFTEARLLTQQVVMLAKSYPKDRGLGDDEAARIREVAYGYCSELAKNGDPFDLKVFSQRVNEISPEDLISYVNENSDRYQIGSSFVPSIRDVKTLKRISFSQGSIRVAFDVELLNQNKVLYNKQEGSLTITNLPDNIRKDLDEYI